MAVRTMNDSGISGTTISERFTGLSANTMYNATVLITVSNHARQENTASDTTMFTTLGETLTCVYNTLLKFYELRS